MVHHNIIVWGMDSISKLGYLRKSNLLVREFTYCRVQLKRFATLYILIYLERDEGRHMKSNGSTKGGGRDWY